MIERAREALEEYRGADAVFQLLEMFHPSRSIGGDYAAAFDLLREIAKTYGIEDPLVDAELEARVRSSATKEDVTAIWSALQAKLFSGAIPNEPPPGPEPASHEELLAAIDADPDDPAPYLVYADWLQQKGDPRGQLIALDHALSERPEDPELKAELTKLLLRYPSLLPAAADHSRHFGFVRKGTVSYGGPREVMQFFAHPAVRFIREASLDRIQNLEPFVAPRHLVSLSLSMMYGRNEIAAIPTLKRLSIFGGRWDIGSAAPTGLEELSLLSVDDDTLDAEIVLPELTTLLFEQPRAPFTRVEHIMRKKNLPSLRHLALCTFRMPKTSCSALARSPLAAELETLDLAGSSLSDAGVRELLKSGAFVGLKRIDVTRTDVSAAGIEMLKRELRAEVIS